MLTISGHGQSIVQGKREQRKYEKQKKNKTIKDGKIKECAN